jgi:hypothetical protein
VFVAVSGNRHTFDQLHDEVRPAGLGSSGVEHPSDIRMVHERQGLSFRLEPGDDLARVQPRLDDLEGHLALDRVHLLGHEDRPHAAFADLLQQFVRADDIPGTFVSRRVHCARKFRPIWWRVGAESIVSGEQGLEV